MWSYGEEYVSVRDLDPRLFQSKEVVLDTAGNCEEDHSHLNMGEGANKVWYPNHRVMFYPLKPAVN